MESVSQSKAPSASSISSLAPCNPGYGYVILHLPYSALFKPIGQHYTVSYLPAELNPDRIGDLTICFWLGPEENQPDTMVFLIWPGRGIMSLGELFTKKQKSCIVYLKEASSFISDPTNAIARDLLQVNQRPCLFFIRQWDETVEVNTTAQDEAEKLCLTNISLKMIHSLRDAMEKRVEPTGDAIKSSCFQEWLSLMYDELRASKPSDFYVDPTALAAGILGHLLRYILENNRFKVSNRSVVYVPMDFVRDWVLDIERASLNYEQMSSLLKQFLDH